jgi:hypothetical protein
VLVGPQKRFLHQLLGLVAVAQASAGVALQPRRECANGGIEVQRRGVGDGAQVPADPTPDGRCPGLGQG